MSDKAKLLKQQLIAQARSQYGQIYPCGLKTSLAECFTDEMGGVQLWFNVDADKSTRMIAKE